MKKDNLSSKIDDKKEEKIESKEELKGNKLLIFLCKQSIEFWSKINKI